jgi:hypothetical protein
MHGIALVSGYISAQIGRLQLAAAAKLMRLSENGVMVDTASVVKLVDMAVADARQFAEAAAGLGARLDITV